MHTCLAAMHTCVHTGPRDQVQHLRGTGNQHGASVSGSYQLSGYGIRPSAAPWTLIAFIRSHKPLRPSEIAMCLPVSSGESLKEDNGLVAKSYRATGG